MSSSSYWRLQLCLGTKGNGVLQVLCEGSALGLWPEEKSQRLFCCVLAHVERHVKMNTSATLVSFFSALVSGSESASLAPPTKFPTTLQFALECRLSTFFRSGMGTIFEFKS